MKKSKILKIAVATLLGGFLFAVGMVCEVNFYVKNTGSDYLMDMKTPQIFLAWIAYWF